MNNPSFSPRPAGVASVAGIARLIRRVCVLREQDNAAGAARLQENDLATAVRDFRLAHGPEALPESELQTLFAEEERRVAEAAILSELLVPRLVECLPASSGPISPRNLRPMPRSLSTATVPAVSPAGPPAIPDLLDAMLAAERTGRRPSSAVPHES